MFIFRPFSPVAVSERCSDFFSPHGTGAKRLVAESAV